MPRKDPEAWGEPSEPALLHACTDDPVTSASHSEAIAAAIPNAELVLLPGVHMLNVERPFEFMNAVMHFLCR